MSPGETVSFEEQSFENIIFFHVRELRRILRGASVSSILSPLERRRLICYGVLIRKGRGKYVQYTISKNATYILEKGHLHAH